MYREVIEHPASLPPVIKKHLDLTSGRDRGRIYRVVPEGFASAPRPKLGMLDRRTGRDAGASERLAPRHGAAALYERQDKAAVPPLRRPSRRSTMPEAHARALRAGELWTR